MRKFTSEELQQVLHDHARWLESEGMYGNRADLSGSDLRRCDLSGSDLSGSDLRRCDLRGDVGLFIPMACPSVGAFTAWKKCRDDLIVKLLIPEDARRLSAERPARWTTARGALTIRGQTLSCVSQR